MQNIQLTKKHKTKLLEMCKVLFPEYNYIKINNNNIITFGKIKKKSYKDDFIDFSEPLKEIHWFELCLTHIQQTLKVFPINYAIHPVDYLYNEFKKLHTS